MASTSSLYLPSLSRHFLHNLRLPPSLLSPPLPVHRFLSTARSTEFPNRSKHLMTPVRAQARRVSPLRDDLVASGKSNIIAKIQSSNETVLQVVSYSRCWFPSRFVSICIIAEDLKFESPLKIVEYPSPLLRAKNKRIATFDNNLKNLVDEMFDVMYKWVLSYYYYFSFKFLAKKF